MLKANSPQTTTHIFETPPHRQYRPVRKSIDFMDFMKLLKSSFSLRQLYAHNSLTFLISLSLVVTGVISILCLQGLDMYLSNAYFTEDVGFQHWRRDTLWHLCYFYAQYPALIVIACGIGSLTYSYYLRGNACINCQWYRWGMYLLCVLILGPGLLINGLIKNIYQRPRPYQLVEFGGTECFVSLGSMGTAGSNSSFPSGHSSIAFFLLAPGLWCLHHHQSKRGWLWLSFGFLYGGLISVSRIAVGAHFLSDTIWACLIMVLVSYMLLPQTKQTQRGSSPQLGAGS